jgi:hypothetical protein
MGNQYWITSLCSVMIEARFRGNDTPLPIVIPVKTGIHKPYLILDYLASLSDE